MSRKPTVRKKLGEEVPPVLKDPTEAPEAPAPTPVVQPVAQPAVYPMCTTSLPTYSTLPKLRL